MMKIGLRLIIKMNILSLMADLGYTIDSVNWAFEVHGAVRSVGAALMYDCVHLLGLHQLRLCIIIRYLTFRV